MLLSLSHGFIHRRRHKFASVFDSISPDNLSTLTGTTRGADLNTCYKERMSLRTRFVVLRPTSNAYGRKDFLFMFIKLDSRLADYKPSLRYPKLLFSGVEGGRRNPSIAVLNRIATALSS